MNTKPAHAPKIALGLLADNLRTFGYTKETIFFILCAVDRHEKLVAALKAVQEDYYDGAADTQSAHKHDWREVFESDKEKLKLLWDDEPETWCHVFRAVDSREELLQAAKFAMEAIRKNGDQIDDLVQAYNVLDQAIARAQEGK